MKEVIIPKEVILKAIEGGWLYENCVPFYSPKYYHTGYGSMQRLVTFHIESQDIIQGIITKHEVILERIALDPRFWMAIRWHEIGCLCGNKVRELTGWHNQNCAKVNARRGWKSHATKFVELLMDGKDTTQFWSDLLGNKE